MEDSSPTPIRGARHLFSSDDVGVDDSVGTLESVGTSDQGSGHCFGRASVILQLSSARAELHKYRKMCYELEVEHVKDQARLVDYERFDERFHLAGEILVCPLCRDIFQIPWILVECGHTFCEACIAGHFALNEDSCPRCHAAITTPPVEDFHTIQLIDIFLAGAVTDPTKRSNVVGRWDKWFRSRAPADNRKVGGF